MMLYFCKSIYGADVVFLIVGEVVFIKKYALMIIL